MPPSLPPAPALGKSKELLDQVCDVMRLKHYSLRTEKAYRDCKRGNQGQSVNRGRIHSCAADFPSGSGKFDPSFARHPFSLGAA